MRPSRFSTQPAATTWQRYDCTRALYSYELFGFPLTASLEFKSPHLQRLRGLSRSRSLHEWASDPDSEWLACRGFDQLGERFGVRIGKACAKFNAAVGRL